MDGVLIPVPAWALGPELTIVQAADNHSLLLEALPQLQSDPRLDLSSVTDMDSSGVQLLLSLRSSLAERGQSLQLLAPTPVVRDALAVFGLLDQFACTEPDKSH